MHHGLNVTICASLFAAPFAMAQSTQQLPLEASNCAIYRALSNDSNLDCAHSNTTGQSRGIVLRLDSELQKQQEQDLKEMISAPKVTTKRKPAPQKKPMVKSVKTVSLSNTKAAAAPKNGYFIQFSLNSFELEPQFKDHLTRLAKVLNAPALASTCIRVTGHTDTTGSTELNKELSSKRAIIVATNLSEIGQIDPNRIQIAALGESKPLPEIKGSDARNRRVEFSTKESPDGCSNTL